MVKTLKKTFKNYSSILISHQIWGRDPPSLCIVTNEEIQIDISVEKSEQHLIYLTMLHDLELKERERLNNLLLDLLMEVSPLPLKLDLVVKSIERQSGLSYLVAAINSMLLALQTFYEEFLSSDDYNNILAGAFMKSGLTLNQAKSLSNCVLTERSVVYSESYGVLQLDLSKKYKWKVSKEFEFPKIWAEPNYSEQYLDLLSKLSSIVISELPGLFTKDSEKKFHTRIHNGIWYILGLPPMTNCEYDTDCNEIVSLSIPGWLVVYRFE